MQESLGVKGDKTSYKLPHMGKDKLTSEGDLLLSIRCDPAVIAIACKALDERDKEVSTPHTNVRTTTGLINGGDTGASGNENISPEFTAKSSSNKI